MRNLAMLIGVHALLACSVDHLVVARLDDAGSAGAPTAGAGEDSAGAPDLAGSAGSAGLNENTSGASGSAGTPSTGAAGDAGVLITSFGGDVGVLIGGDAGASSQFICSCLSNQSELCGTDGVTYDGVNLQSSCEDGGACSPPSIACWHACPCNPGESSDLNSTTTWFTPDCAGSAQCTGDFTCMAFSGDVKIMCGNTTGN